MVGTSLIWVEFLLKRGDSCFYWPRSLPLITHLLQDQICNIKKPFLEILKVDFSCRISYYYNLIFFFISAFRTKARHEGEIGKVWFGFSFPKPCRFLSQTHSSKCLQFFMLSLPNIPNLTTCHHNNLSLVHTLSTIMRKNPSKCWRMMSMYYA